MVPVSHLTSDLMLSSFYKGRKSLTLLIFSIDACPCDTHTHTRARACAHTYTHIHIHTHSKLYISNFGCSSTFTGWWLVQSAGWLPGCTIMVLHVPSSTPTRFIFKISAVNFSHHTWRNNHDSGELSNRIWHIVLVRVHATKSVQLLSRAAMDSCMASFLLRYFWQKYTQGVCVHAIVMHVQYQLSGFR